MFKYGVRYLVMHLPLVYFFPSLYLSSHPALKRAVGTWKFICASSHCFCTFVCAHSFGCTTLNQLVAESSLSLSAKIAEIPKLITGCNDFMDDAQQILEKRQLNRTLLANHSSLLDLLEIPQLMDT